MTASEEVELLWLAAQHPVNFRTVASRAYYACFNRCMASVVARGFVPDQTGLDHAGVPKFLKALNGLNLANLLYRIATDRLPKLRKHADYNIELHFPRFQAENAVDLMRDVLGYLDEVEAANAP